MQSSIEKSIQDLKRSKNAVILAHYYEDSDVQDVADHIGDSLFLAQEGARTQADVILLAGVVFMAESVKILSPHKAVLVPDLNAGCSLVSGSPFDSYLAWRKRYPSHIMVTYVNSSAEVKSLSDVICTSSNAEKVIASIPKDRGILFGPDRQLGRWLSQKTGREFELWPGACEVHVLFNARQLYDLKIQHPEALVIAHPECNDAVLAQSDVIGATSKLLETVAQGKFKKYIVATEDGIFHQMRKANPNATLIQAPTEKGCGCNQCPYMKLNTLEKIQRALETLSPQVNLDENLRKRALIPLQRMMQITEGKSVLWPAQFQ